MAFCLNAKGTETINEETRRAYIFKKENRKGNPNAY